MLNESIKQRNQRILDEACRVIDDKITSFALSEGILLTEAYTAKNFAGMVKRLQKLEKIVPNDMTHTLQAIVRATADTYKNYKRLLKNQISKDDFADLSINAAALIASLHSSFEDINATLALERVAVTINARFKAAEMRKNKQTLVPKATSNQKKLKNPRLRDILTADTKSVLRTKVEMSFKQPKDLLLKIWKKLSPTSVSWFGLTEELLYTDFMNLSRAGLKRLTELDDPSLDNVFTPIKEDEIIADIFRDNPEIEEEIEEEAAQQEKESEENQDAESDADEADHEFASKSDKEFIPIGHGTRDNVKQIPSIAPSEETEQKALEPFAVASAKEKKADKLHEPSSGKGAVEHISSKSEKSKGSDKSKSTKAASAKKTSSKNAKSRPTIIPDEEPLHVTKQSIITFDNDDDDDDDEDNDAEEEHPVDKAKRLAKIRANPAAKGFKPKSNESINYSDVDKLILEKWRRMAGISMKGSN